MEFLSKDESSRALGGARRPEDERREPQRARLILPTDSRERARIVIGGGK